ncbi:MAG TPA: hypothetical protein VL563_17795 [Gemmatimonadales bacterium]|nr:hypothetical protein [Gemmatimonadales bacterium]
MTRVRAIVALLTASGAVFACETNRNVGGVGRDTTVPTISLTPVVSDTQNVTTGLQFTVSASDNLTLQLVRLTYTGGYVAGPVDTTFPVGTPTVNFQRTITFPANTGVGGNVRVVGRAVDGAGNFSEDTLQIFLINVQALNILIVQPVNGAQASTGRSLPVQVIAFHQGGIRKVGFLVSPPGSVTNPTGTDSVSYPVPYPDSVNFYDTVTVAATSGTITLTGFAEDSGGRRGTSSPVTVTLQTAATDTVPPSVSDNVGTRVEVSDSVSVHATDPSAITFIGLRVRDLGGTVLTFDSIDVTAGNLTDVTRSFSLNLAGKVTTFPTNVLVQGYACDGATARNCAFSQVGAIPGAAQKVDTALVVAGVTRPLPAGGSIADAIFDANDSTLFLTNPTLSRLEIFQVANTAFVAGGIPTAGPQPWGIALWPRDTLGNYGDTVVVANSGGTELSIIDVRPAARRLVWRQDLPNYLIETYKVLQQSGGSRREITVHDVSDRPQYVATVCRAAGGTACSPDSIFAVYSTTPTASSSSPFDGRATLRMEKLKNTIDTTQLFGHFFWEIGTTPVGAGTDTLRIEMRLGLPYNQTKTILSACAGVNVVLNTFGLGDSTFTRNSGNFTHAFIGEGGISSQFARVFAYSAKQALVHDVAQPPCNTGGGTADTGLVDVDFGVSPGVDVSDFISNTGVHVSSIATNFNGETNVVRADSIYFLDEGLRLKGASVAPIGAPGMDMNYNHNDAAGQPGTPANRILFAARPDANIDVFDTFYYGVIGSIPIRDPIIGPLRVARDAAGNQLLFGITARGLVMVRLPAIANPFPTPGSVRTR